MEASVDPLSRGPDWMPITPNRGSFLHADLHLGSLSHGLLTLPEVRIPHSPRMADFAQWAAACERPGKPSEGPRGRPRCRSRGSSCTGDRGALLHLVWERVAAPACRRRTFRIFPQPGGLAHRPPGARPPASSRPAFPANVGNRDHVQPRRAFGNAHDQDPLGGIGCSVSIVRLGAGRRMRRLEGHGSAEFRLARRTAGLLTVLTVAAK